MLMLKRALLAMAAFAPVLGSTPVTADPIGEFYKGKTVKIMVGASAGGGYDVYARVTARHLPRHLPGSPTIVVQNRPGAASINAANYLYNVAPQDGSVIGAIGRGAPILQIMGDKGPKFVSTKFQWLGSLSSDAGAMYVWHTSKVKTFKDTFTTPVFFGSSGPNDSEFYPALANNVLGTKFALIKGYRSGPMVRLAMENGEVEGQSQTWDSVKSASPKWISEGKIRVIAQIALKPREDMRKMGVPMIMDFVTREHVLPQFTVKEAQTFFKLLLVGKQLSRPFVAGPGVPGERVAALRKAFMSMAADKKFVKDTERQGRGVAPVSGEEMQATINELAATPKPVLAKVKNLIKFKGVVKQAKVVVVKVTGKVTKSVKKGRRLIIMQNGKEVSAKTSRSRTKVTIAGKKAARGDIKAKMTCVVSIIAGEASKIVCD